MVSPNSILSAIDDEEFKNNLSEEEKAAFCKGLIFKSHNSFTVYKIYNLTLSGKIEFKKNLSDWQRWFKQMRDFLCQEKENILV